MPPPLDMQPEFSFPDACMQVVVTTSHDPSSRLKMFLKEVRLLVPNAERVNRGSYTTKEIVQAKEPTRTEFQ